jgi:ORF6N domain
VSAQEGLSSYVAEMKKSGLGSLSLRAAASVEAIERRIYAFRGHKVMLDWDLANLFGVRTKVLNQAVKRNPDHSPSDFMFELTPEESRAMRSQFVTASRRNIRHRPYGFTEQGVAMLRSLEEKT